MNSHTTHGFYVVHFQGGSYVHRNCDYIISEESTHSSAATYYAARDLLGNSAFSARIHSLLDLFSFYSAFFLQYIPSLSLSIPADCYIHAQGANYWLQ